MPTPESSQPYLSVDFGPNGGQFSWMTHAEATQWLKDIQAQWAWIENQETNQTNGVIRNTHSVIHNAFHTVIQNFQNAQGQHHREHYFSQAKDYLEQFVRSNPWLLPKSAQRKFIEDLRDSGKPLDAALIVAHLAGQSIQNVHIAIIFRALLHLELYERGINRLSFETDALKKLGGDIQTELTNQQAAERNQIAKFDTLHGKIDAQSATQQGAFDKAQGERDGQWKEKMANVQQELDQLKKTYDEHMALQAPVDYWESKRKHHRTLVWWLGGAVIAGMVIAAWLLHKELTGIGVTAATPQPAGQNSSGLWSILQSAATWHLGAFVLEATIAFWALRLLVRMFLSNLHLENDAAERVTMAKTYLAMLRDKALLKPEDGLKAVLAALFRPTGDGIVKDDGAPPNLLDVLSKVGGK